jgi:hypothetical protein
LVILGNFYLTQFLVILGNFYLTQFLVILGNFYPKKQKEAESVDAVRTLDCGG